MTSQVSERKIQDWVDNDRYRDVPNGDMPALVGGTLIASVVISAIWALLVCVLSTMGWSAFTGWSAQDDDQVPPYTEMIVTSGVVIIAALGMVFLVSSIVDTHRAKLPYDLVNSQIAAAKSYSMLDESDKTRARDALIEFISTPRSYDYDLYIARSNRFDSVMSKIHEKNALQRKLELRSSKTLDIENEISILDEEIENLKLQVECDDQLN